MVEVEALQEILLQLQTVEDHSEVVVAVQAALAEPGAREVLGVPSATAEAEQEAAESAPDDIPTPAESQDANAEMESEDEGSEEGGDEDVAE